MNERELKQRKMSVQNRKETKIILMREMDAGRVKGQY